jgi:hypothetical protein
LFGNFSGVGNDYAEKFIAFTIFAFSGFEKALEDFCFFCGSEASELIDEGRNLVSGH